MSQENRLPHILKTLKKFSKDTIIGLAEVEGTRNGELIANRLGNQTKFFVEHHRPNDYIGVTSALKFKPRYIQIDKNCRAIVTEYGGVAVVTVHLTWTMFNEPQRKRQIRTLLSHLDASIPMIIMGDLNSLSWQGSRKLLKKAGFCSTLGRSLAKRLPTVPRSEYRHMYPQPHRTIGRFGLTVDDIYARGVEVLDSGTFEGESDHLGVWTKITLPQSNGSKSV